MSEGIYECPWGGSTTGAAFPPEAQLFGNPLVLEPTRAGAANVTAVIRLFHTGKALPREELFTQVPEEFPLGEPLRGEGGRASPSHPKIRIWNDGRELGGGRATRSHLRWEYTRCGAHRRPPASEPADGGHVATGARDFLPWITNVWLAVHPILRIIQFSL